MLYILIFIFGVPAPESDKQLALDYLERKVDIPYEDYSFSQYYILAANEDIIDGLFYISRDPKYRTKWKDSIRILGTIGRLEPTSFSFDRLSDLVSFYETEPENDQALSCLTQGYAAVARYGTEESLEFLIKRTQASFWQNKNNPEGLIIYDHVLAPEQVTAQSQAFLALALHPSEEAERYLREQQNNPDLDEASLRKIKSGLISRNAWLNSYKSADEAQRMKEERRRELQAQTDGDKSPELESPPVSDVPTPEPKESPLWPWALGGVVVLVLLGFVLLRRSDKD